MQDRYSGDVGDFQKLGLLRTLCTADDERSVGLGINWYLVPDESHNADGKHTGYLNVGNRFATKLYQCDPELYWALKQVVDSGRRSVNAIEAAGVLPAGTSTFSKVLTPSMNLEDRRHWHERALRQLSAADLVFLDPDNGMSMNSWATKHYKFAFADEIADYVRRDQSVVVYHQADRSKGGVPAQTARRMSELREATGVDPAGAIIARRGSCRFFLVVPADRERDLLSERLQGLAERWNPHLEFHPWCAPT